MGPCNGTSGAMLGSSSIFHLEKSTAFSFLALQLLSYTVDSQMATILSAQDQEKHIIQLLAQPGLSLGKGEGRLNVWH